MARKEFSRSVKLQAIKRATIDGNLFCEICGGLIKGKFEIDHINPDGLTGQPTLENAQIACSPCHKEKTASDVGSIAKAKRVEARHIGLRKSSKGFPRREKETLALTRVVPRRSLYEDTL